MELAEAAAERHMLVVADVLVAKEEHKMLEQPPVQRAESLVVERLTQVHTMHFRADMASERPELDNVVPHFLLLLRTDTSVPAIMRNPAWRRQRFDSPGIVAISAPGMTRRFRPYGACINHFQNAD